MAQRIDIQRISQTVTHTVVLLVLLILSTTGAYAQSDTPEFDIDAVNTLSERNADATRLDVYTKVPYSGLRFLNTPQGFSASYEVSLDVYEFDVRGRSRNLVQNKVWEQTVTVEDFSRTQTDQLYDRTVQTLSLAPGRYLLQVHLEDEAADEAYVRELPVVVRDLSRPVAVGDLILIDAYDPEANSITPSISNRIGTEERNFRIFYEVYAERARTVRIRREVIRIGKGSGASTVKALLGFGEEGASTQVSYEETTPRNLRAGRNPFVVEIPMDDFKVGEYVARVRVEDENGNLLDQAEKSLVAQWSGLAEHIQDLSEAIAQLQYIAKKKDVEFIMAGQTQAERLARFRAFWEKRDPTPGTERNERMEEYYYRISFANSQYGNFGAGWKTDRGLILIKFGEPDYIERHPFNYNVKPYEVWYYYGIGRRFIFIDETGLGDFELLVPYWDERTRIR